ncbi:MAG: hypothetical protein NXI04_06355 [Planctomycetaceae bacterium]|nr:hypothetical protein [Planctomycetaceae bacterium]
MRELLTILLTATIAPLSFAEEPYRPSVGHFPAPEHAKVFRGELVFVDHVNRRGSLRLHIDDYFREGKLHHFAMLPCGEIYYRGAPASLADIPLGTVLYGRFYLPPDPKTSAVPAVSGKDPSAPAENHCVLLQDDVSLSHRQRLPWNLTQVIVKDGQAELVAQIDRGQGGVTNEAGLDGRHTFTVDRSTRVWRGRELLGIDDLMAEDVWPAGGEKTLQQQAWLSLTWHPRYLYQQFHVSDIWLDERSLKVAAERQRQRHIRHIRTRWMPAAVDSVDYGKFGAAVVTVTLFGGKEESLYADFQPGGRGKMAAAENTLRTWWPDHDGMDGTILTVERRRKRVPTGSSGIRLRFQVPLVLEGFRPGRIVRLRPAGWPNVKPPFEERVRGLDERWPSPDIFRR